MRVERLSLHRAEGRRTFYDVTLSLTNKGLASNLGGSSGDPGDFPYTPPGCTAGDRDTNILSGTVTLDPGSSSSYGSSGALTITGSIDDLANATGNYGLVSTGACCVDYPGGVAHWQWNVDLGSAKSLSYIEIYDSPQSPNGGGTHVGVEVWASDDGSTYHQATTIGDWVDRSDIAPQLWQITIPDADRTHRYWGIRFIEHFVSGFWGGFETHGFRLIECVGGSVEQPPASGQWVYFERATPDADGATTTFFTRWPFADGSLQVIVNGIGQTAAVASYDGAAGTFTMSWTPTSGETPIVAYQGR